MWQKRNEIQKYKRSIVLGTIFVFAIVMIGKEQLSRDVLVSTPVSTLVSTTAETASETETQTISIRISSYWPPYGPPNCNRFSYFDRIGSKYCMSRTASGERWEKWINLGAACPNSWPFYTRLELPGGEWFTCVDHLHRRFSEGWIDLMVFEPPVPYGTSIEIRVIFP